MLSRVAVGPTVRRGRTFVLVSYCTIVIVCIPRLLAVVVTLKIMHLLLFAPLLYMSNYKINTTVLVYDKLKRIASTKFNPTEPKTLPESRKYIYIYFTFWYIYILTSLEHCMFIKKCAASLETNTKISQVYCQNRSLEAKLKKKKKRN